MYMSSNTHWQGAIQIVTTGQLDFSGNMITSRTDNANIHGNLCTLSFYLEGHACMGQLIWLHVGLYSVLLLSSGVSLTRFRHAEATKGLRE